MCIVNEYISRTGCGHNVDVFRRCAKAINEGQIQCDSTYIAKPISLENKRCENCESNDKNEVPQNQKPKRNRAKDLFDKLLQYPRRIKHDAHEGFSPPRRQQVASMANGRWKGGQGIRKTRPKPRKRDRIEFDAACVDYLTMELDYGEAKENNRPKPGRKHTGPI
ncbi:hypothetical protein TWF569_002980 [Orbilia oligospora]|uniref:Uncharacterized protein n=1 Tax=Orbilia oligospora TaxID=2813651 RepID=A0A7C8JS71_ORBOL|nr:hypothetical protein TWF706_007392 [Orbilia oligospora]KAF3111425.1 hypothetical protein TWF102_007090 [Orbilia oligospora]KAF3117250.1 hypothetical protein TWF103_007394 [Orbilia oligospora]KAF3140295.1 hypothetical protein TWF703_003168 [Orbilia oligospora]KAF3140812.1 hypothetical protein TWF594_006309 [Orbilia oligospora]